MPGYLGHGKTMKQDNKEAGITQRLRRQILIAGAASVALLPISALAQQAYEWMPTQPIRLIAGQAPGSSNDALARAYADYFTEKLKVSVIVENRPGGAGMIAGQTVAKSTPDGHTLLLTLQSAPALAPVLLKNPPIDTDKDLVPIASMGVGPLVAVVHKDFPVKNLAELIEYAKKKPVNAGNYAIGSAWQLMLNQLSKETGGQYTVLNYKGTGAMAVDLYGGTLDIGAGSLAGLGAGIEKGYVRPVAIIMGSKSARFPGLPTWGDAGFKGPVFEDLIETNMLMAPAGTPQVIIDTFARLVTDSITESEKVKAARTVLSEEGQPLVGAELKEFIARSWPTYRKLTRDVLKENE